MMHISVLLCRCSIRELLSEDWCNILSTGDRSDGLSSRASLEMSTLHNFKVGRDDRWGTEWISKEAEEFALLVEGLERSFAATTVPP